jgi:starch synthase
MGWLDVLAVVSELFPLIKTGGLADVAGALPTALEPLGVRVRTLIPGYPAVLAAIDDVAVVAQWPNWFGDAARVLQARAGDLDLFVLDAPHLYHRPGGPYAGPDGRDFPDNAPRFAALARAGAAIGQGLVADYRPAVIHTHDWQAGLTPAYLRYGDGPRPPVVATIHNLAFQGRYDAALLRALGLPPYALDMDGVEFYGGIGFLKASLRLSDWITTVSPTYAAEICTAEGGMGLEGLLRTRSGRLSGILNGVDTAIWDPATDPYVAARYDAVDPGPRAINKAALQARFNLAQAPGAPLFGVITRLSWQKGLDLLLEALPTLLDAGAQLVVLGAGDADLQQGFAAAAAGRPGQIGCEFGYDEALAHQIQAGIDSLIVPSRFEPCGLTQLCALRYGAVPLVARVGGLADTVIDATPMALASGVATGVQYAPVLTSMLERAIRRTVELYRRPDAWRRIQANGMAADVSWRDPARQYAELFERLATGEAR